MAKFHLEGFYDFFGYKTNKMRGIVDITKSGLKGSVFTIDAAQGRYECRLKGKFLDRGNNKLDLAFVRSPDRYISDTLSEKDKDWMTAYGLRSGISRNYLTRSRTLPDSSGIEGIFSGVEFFDNVYPGKMPRDDNRKFSETLDDMSCWTLKEGNYKLALSLSKNPISPFDPNCILRNFGVFTNPVMHHIKGTYLNNGETVGFDGKIEIENGKFIGIVSETLQPRSVDIEGQIQQINDKQVLTFRKIYGGLTCTYLYRMEKTGDTIDGKYSGGWESDGDAINIGLGYKPGIGEVVVVQELGKLRNTAELTLEKAVI